MLESPLLSKAWAVLNGTFRVITDATLGFNDATGRLHVRSLYAESKGNLWIGNSGARTTHRRTV